MGLIWVLACAPKVQTQAPASMQMGAGELVIRGTPLERAQAPDADLVLFYGGEIGGSLGTCGCPDRPRGSMARMASYLHASREAHPGQRDLVLMGGDWLMNPVSPDGSPSAQAPVANGYVAQAFDAMGVDAANVGYGDLPGVLALETLPPWAISTNTQGLPTSRVVDLDGVRVGILAITRFGVQPVPGHSISDAYAPAAAALQELSQSSEVQVLLSYGAGEVAAQLARDFPELDVVIDADMHRGFFAPDTIGEAIWVRSHYQTMRLGELRLDISEGKVGLIVDRKIDLDPLLPDDPVIAALALQAEDALAEALQGTSREDATQPYVLNPE